MSIRCASVYINICILYKYLHIILYFGRMSLFIIHIQLAQKDGKGQSFFTFPEFPNSGLGFYVVLHTSCFFLEWYVFICFYLFFLHGYTDNFVIWSLDLHDSH